MALVVEELEEEEEEASSLSSLGASAAAAVLVPWNAAATAARAPSQAGPGGRR